MSDIFEGFFESANLDQSAGAVFVLDGEDHVFTVDAELFDQFVQSIDITARANHRTAEQPRLDRFVKLVDRILEQADRRCPVHFPEMAANPRYDVVWNGHKFGFLRTAELILAKRGHRDRLDEMIVEACL